MKKAGNFMKIIKKILCITLCLALCSFFSACHRNEYIDYSEFNRRLKSENKLYKFCEDEIFYKSSVYYVFFSLVSEKDILITMREDGEHIIDRISITAAGQSDTADFNSAFPEYIKAVIRSFVPEKYSDVFINELNSAAEVLFGDYFNTTESGFYSLSVFSDKTGINFTVTRN